MQSSSRKQGSQHSPGKQFPNQPPLHDKLPLPINGRIFELLDEAQSRNVHALFNSGSETEQKTLLFLGKLLSTLENDGKPIDAKYINVQIEVFFQNHVNHEVSSLFTIFQTADPQDLEIAIQNVLLKLTGSTHPVPLPLTFDDLSERIYLMMGIRSDAEIILSRSLIEMLARKYPITAETPSAPQRRQHKLRLRLESVSHDLRNLINILGGKMLLFHDLETAPAAEVLALYRLTLLTDKILNKDAFGHLSINTQKTIIIETIASLKKLLGDIIRGPTAAEAAHEAHASGQDCLGPICPEDMERLTELTSVLLGDKISKKPRYLESLIQEAFYEVKATREAGPSAVNVEFSMAKENEIPKVNLDKSGILEVFDNLFTNAFDAISNYGKISVRIEAKDGSVIVDTSDNGCGIQEDQLKRVFTPHFTTKGGENSGLGLYIVKNIVEQHGGTVSVKSKTGAGTTFTITLPVN